MLNTKLHRQIMFNVLSGIYKSEVGRLLGFKGGTMAYFFYGLDRFSVDLDFDLLDKQSITQVQEQLSPILSKYGQLKDVTNKRFTLFYLLNYQSGQRNLKIEISKRLKLPVTYRQANFFGVPIKIMRIEDSFATKLLACLTRTHTAYRDFYDVYFYLTKGIQANPEVIKIGSGQSVDDYLDKLIKFVQNKLTNRAVINAIGELVDGKTKEWIRKSFKLELTRSLQFYKSQLT